VVFDELFHGPPHTPTIIVVHSDARHEILPIIRLADIKIHIIADTDPIYIYQNSTCIGQNCHFKNTVLILIYENNVIRVYKINFPINQPTITDTDTTTDFRLLTDNRCITSGS